MLAVQLSARKANYTAYFTEVYTRAAIRTHLAITWLSLWLKPKTLFSARRRFMLKTLRRYWIQGIFPKNTRYTRYTPVFRDDFGTLCAMGHLACVDGQTDLVSGIANSNNQINLTIEYSAGFNAWLQTTGLTYKEAARIQPSYSWHDPYAEPASKLLGDKDQILVLLILIPLYICLIGMYMIVGKRILKPGSISRIIFVASVTIAILAAVSSLLLIASGYYS